MAQVVYRGNLSAAVFPLISNNQGQTIIVKQYDNTFFPTVASQADADKDAGIPQIMYCHNVMPHAQGFGSIGYIERVASSALVNSFTSAFRIRDDVGNRATFSHTSDGKQYVQLAGTNVWTYVDAIAGTAGKPATYAYVNGKTYIYFSGVGCYEYNFGTGALVSVTLTGLTVADILGITSTAGYLIAWSKNAVAWSSTTDVTDFVPSLSTGAGGGGVEGARGTIVHCANTVQGIIIYTTENAVAAAYSGNARYPFNFREITNAGGIASAEFIAYDANNSAQYAYTSYGLQVVNIQSGSLVFPEVTDFLTGKIFEDFDESLVEFTRTNLATTMLKKLTFISGRYLVISYGIVELTHALIYDAAEKRWGKVKITHVDAFEYSTQMPEVLETPRDSLAFLSSTGRIVTMDFKAKGELNLGVIMLGKFQYIRQRMLELQTVDFENIAGSGTFKLYDLPTINGKTYLPPVQATVIEQEEDYRKFGLSVVGKNHTLVAIGSFFLNSLVLAFNVHGRQ